MQKKMFPQNVAVWANMRKRIVAMATRNAIRENGGAPTKSIISQLLLIVGY